MKCPFLHAPDFPPDMAGHYRISLLPFTAWTNSMPIEKHPQAARVARYLAIRANRNPRPEKENDPRIPL
jgi:hypothetical protein